MRPRSRIQTTGPNNGHQLRDYSKSSNRSENRPLIYLNPNDNSGEHFLNEIMGEESPNLLEYMFNARNNRKYDFKVTNGTEFVIKDIDPQRGMPISSTSDGTVTYASARDIGNMAAGYMAAKYGITWKAARKAFDFYQGSPEGRTTVSAELYGYTVLGHNTAAQRVLRQLRKK